MKQRLAEPRPLLAPGVYDALSALIAERAGFEALYLSGASIAYTRLGRSDVGLTTFPEVQDTLARITERVRTPVIVDGDTGFGNALNVQRTVRGFERAGAAMVQLEDQTFPKRCGHLEGKAVVPVAEMCGNMVEGGQTPVQSAAELGERGFRIVIFPGGTARAVAHTLQGYYASLAQQGTTAPWRDRMLDFDGLNAVIGTPELLADGRRYE